jgi:AcrR family transcriptional regulator
MEDAAPIAEIVAQHPAKTSRRPAVPRQRDADQTKINILEAALAEFADKGLAGARVDEIARKTATSKHMIYYYFSSKEGLYRAVLDNAYANFRFAEQTIDYALLDPVEALTTLTGLSFDFHIDNPQYVRIIMGENINNGEHIQHVANVERRRAILDTMNEIVSRGMASGKFRSGIDVLHLHMTISALSFYYVANRFSFGHIFGVDLEAPAMIAARRAHVIDAALSVCLPRAG